MHAKRQHYVPQFLLRNFAPSDEEQIHVYDKTNDRWRSGRDGGWLDFSKSRGKAYYTESENVGTLEEALKIALKQYGFVQYATYCTDRPDQDEAARTEARKWKDGGKYDLVENNCDHMASAAVVAAGGVGASHIRRATPNETWERVVRGGAVTITQIP